MFTEYPCVHVYTDSQPGPSPPSIWDLATVVYDRVLANATKSAAATPLVVGPSPLGTGLGQDSQVKDSQGSDGGGILAGTQPVMVELVIITTNTPKK